MQPDQSINSSDSPPLRAVGALRYEVRPENCECQPLGRERNGNFLL